MPIKRLQAKDRAGRMPRIGKLRKGGAKQGNKPGKDLDYFRFTFEIDEAAEKAYYKIYGNQPRSLPVLLPFPHPEDNWEAWVEEWAGGQLMERGDGETAVSWREKKGAPLQHGERPMTVTNNHKNSGRLQVILPELAKAGHMGITVLVTSSAHDIVKLESRLLYYWNQSRGNLQGIRFNLTRVLQGVLNPKDGKVYKKWLVELTVDPTWAMMQLQAQQSAAYGLIAEPISPLLIEESTGEIVDEENWDIVDDIEETPKVIDKPAKAAPKPSQKTEGRALRMIHAIGGSTYGKKWDEVRPMFVKKAKGMHPDGDSLPDSSSAGSLTENQTAEMVDLLKKRQANLSNPEDLEKHLSKLLSLDLTGIVTAVILAGGSVENMDGAEIVKLFTSSEDILSNIDNLKNEYAESLEVVDPVPF